MEQSSGALVRYGPTSLWKHKKASRRGSELEPDFSIQSGDWVNWSQNLPIGLGLTREIHDQAVAFFASFYAPWGLTVDIPAFLVDLEVCNLVRPAGWDQGSPPARTAHYSPLLHCCVLYLGITFMRTEYPALVGALDLILWDHTSKYLIMECDQAALSSLRAYNLLAK